MSDTFCTYGEAGSLYGGDDYGVCGLRGVRGCVASDSPETDAEPMDPSQLVSAASGPADRASPLVPCSPGQEC